MYWLFHDFFYWLLTWECNFVLLICTFLKNAKHTLQKVTKKWNMSNYIVNFHKKVDNFQQTLCLTNQDLMGLCKSFIIQYVSIMDSQKFLRIEIVSWPRNSWFVMKFVVKSREIKLNMNELKQNSTEHICSKLIWNNL